MRAEYQYSVYGLHLVSDEAIPGLWPLTEPLQGNPVVSVRFRGENAENPITGRDRETLWYTSDITDENDNPALRIWKARATGNYSIRYSHGLEFRVDREASAIAVARTNGASMSEVAEFLLGPILGIVLRLRGITCLHASAVAVGNEAIAFAGAAGAGKSTAAAVFVQGGHAGLADDIVPLREQGHSFEVLPGHPWLNLWPDSRAMLERRLSHTQVDDGVGDKQRWVLSNGERRFCSKALRLGAVYMLGELRDGPNAPRVVPMAPQAALINLIANTYANKLPDPATRAREFALLGRLVSHVPIRRAIAHQDPAQFSQLYELIREDRSARDEHQKDLSLSQP